MTERKKIGLPARPQDDAQADGPSTRGYKPPVRGTAPRQRPTAAQAEQARQERAAARAARDVRDERDAHPPREDRGWRDARDERSRQDPRDPRGSRDARDAHSRRDDRGSSSAPSSQRPSARPRSATGPDQQGRSNTGRSEPWSGSRSEHRPARPAPPAVEPSPREDDGRVRLSKLMSERGLASRREADTWIEQGWVQVDGEVMCELGVRVFPHQTITIDPAAREQQAQRVTIVLHKPVGYVSGQAEDGHEPAVVLITPENHWKDDHTPIRFNRAHLRKLAPAGRLDIDSTGLLVLTQDGRVAKHLIGEDSDVEKEYLVRVQWQAEPEAENVAEVVPPEVIELLRHGLSLDDRPLKPAKVSWQNEHQLRFVLKEGKKRQIRRMCEQVGLKVVGLKRVRMGRIPLGKLPWANGVICGPMSVSKPSAPGVDLPAWVVVVALGCLTGLQPLSTDMYLPALPEMQRGLGMSPSLAQWTLSVLIMAFGVGQLIWAPSPIATVDSPCCAGAWPGMCWPVWRPRCPPTPG